MLKLLIGGAGSAATNTGYLTIYPILRVQAGSMPFRPVRSFHDLVSHDLHLVVQRKVKHVQEHEPHH